ncbi:MAG: hypothetical protein KGI35_03230 [Burkholderiales bacterium]|nr:hypothetical protein [Burkholderiales bacterium]MDE2397012.1 hypothetical protein [Burkholderiales bacterium]
MNDDEQQSKDDFFQQVAQLSNAMIAAHGKDFTMGTLILAARFIAEGQAPAAAASEPESKLIVAAA